MLIKLAVDAFARFEPEDKQACWKAPSAEPRGAKHW